MPSIPNRAILGLAALTLSGCMQSLPTAGEIVKPTTEAFARLRTWASIGGTPGEQRLQVVTPLPPEPAIPAIAPPATRPLPLSSRVARARSLPVHPKPIASPVAPHETFPGKVSCRTSTQPDERVRMECVSLD